MRESFFTQFKDNRRLSSFETNRLIRTYNYTPTIVAINKNRISNYNKFFINF